CRIIEMELTHHPHADAIHPVCDGKRFGEFGMNGVAPAIKVIAKKAHIIEAVRHLRSPWSPVRRVMSLPHCCSFGASEKSALKGASEPDSGRRRQTYGGLLRV